MTAAAKLIGFAAVLGLAFGAAALAGAAIDPAKPEQAAPAHGAKAAPAHRARDGDEMQMGGGHADGDHATAGAAMAARGLAVSEGGYTLEADRTHFEAGRPTRFSFRIADARGRVLRDEFEREHDREMHLILVRRDTAVYRHVHPRRRHDGTWTVDLTLPSPGAYRAYADFKIAGTPRTLATDLFAPGNFRAVPLPKPVTRDATEGYEVELRRGAARAGHEASLTFAVTRDGRPVRGLQEYLGARGHLVALREGDLAYLHVHPRDSGPRDEIPFQATFPTAGRYRLFLQFKARGRVHTVDYTLGPRR